VSKIVALVAFGWLLLSMAENIIVGNGTDTSLLMAANAAFLMGFAAWIRAGGR
jgi:hypothetical protein